MAKHLTLSERSFIERAIHNGMCFAEIGRRLNRSPSTISREIYDRRAFANHKWQYENDCVRYTSCLKNKICPNEERYSCLGRCKFCKEKDCRAVCETYVCTGCSREKTCKRDHAYYTANRAQGAYEKLWRDSRSGIRVSPERLVEIGNLIQPLIAKGQSINQILATHGEEIGLCEKTIYNYVDAGAFQVKNIDLPKKVAYRIRRKKPVLTRLEYKYRLGRTYEDFKSYLEAHPDIAVVEMDTVKSARGSKKAILTIIFRQSNFMVGFLMEHCSEECVIAVFDMLSDALGLDTFRALFPVILTDNGVEFKDPDSLERTRTDALRTRVFYCDPQASWQKPHVEKNHVFLRRIIPKGTSFDMLFDQDITITMSHLNSVPREIFGNKTPFQLFTGEPEKKLLELLSLFPVSPDEVVLKPTLLNLKKR